MADVLYKQTASVTLFGNPYPCESGNITVSINSPIHFEATVLGKGGNGVNQLTVGMITSIAMKLQQQIYADPKKATCSFQATGNRGSIRVDGIVTGVALTATTQGGLALRINGTSKDSLMDMFNGKIYTENLSTRKLSTQNDKTPKNQQPGSILKGIVKGLNDKTLTGRIDSIISSLMNKFGELQGISDLSPSEQKVVNAIHQSNKQIYGEIIKPFLKNSKSAKIYGGKADINDTTVSSIINNGLVGYFLESGESFFSMLLSQANTDFGMWYVPSKKDHYASGVLKEQTFGDEKDEKTIMMPMDRIDFDGGSFFGPNAPCKGVAVTAGIAGEAATEVDKLPKKYKFFKFYPEKPVRDWGTYLRFSAPAWCTISAAEAEKLMDAADTDKIKEGKKQQGGRSVNAVKEQATKTKKEIKKRIDKTNPILDYLAQKFYFRSLLADSQLRASGPFWGEVSADVGDVVKLQAAQGGVVCKGILDTVSYNFYSEGESSTTVTIMAAQLGSIKIQ